MKHSYIQLVTSVGNNFNDPRAYSSCNQIIIAGMPQVPNAKNAIIDDICEHFPLADRKKIEYIYDNPGTPDTYLAPVATFWEEDGILCEEIQKNKVAFGWNHNGAFCACLRDALPVKLCYAAEEIDDDDAIYIAVKEYRDNSGNGGSKQRFFHKPFHSYEDALDYVDETDVYNPKNIVLSELDPSSFDAELPDCDKYVSYQVLAFDKNKIKDTDWFKTNMKVIELADELGISPTTDFFSDVEYHLSALNAINKTKNCSVQR